MKKKLDFVTNSSSTSFIFTDKDLTIRDAAIDMIDLISNEYKLDFPGSGKCSWAISAKKKLRKIDPNTNVILPWSCNYPSFLYRDSNGHIRVDTSWNHHWEDLSYETVSVSESDDEYKKSNKQNFLNLQTGKLKTRIEHRIDDLLTFQKQYGHDNYIKETIKVLRKEMEEESESKT